MPSTGYPIQSWYRRNPKLVRIGSDPYSPPITNVSGAPKTYAATAATVDTTVLPTGTGTTPAGDTYTYLPWTNLYSPVTDYNSTTQTIDFLAAMNRATTGSVVTFGETKNMTPSGTIQCEDFLVDPYQAGLFIPSKVRGIWGSGRGTLGSTGTGTVFSMRPGSSTKANAYYRAGTNADGTPIMKPYIPPQDNRTPTQLNVMKHLGPFPWTGSPVYHNFQVAGTEQGHIFSAFQIYGTGGAVDMDGLLITGWDGNNGAPPGETSALAVSGVGPHWVRNVEVDGRRVPGGTVYGGMGMTFQNSVRAKFQFCNVHHTRVAAFVLYQAFYCRLEDCVFDATYSPDDRPAIGNGAMNLERSAAATLVRVTFGGRWNRLHTTLSGDGAYSLTQQGVTYNLRDVLYKDGSATIIDPIYNDLWGNNNFMVQSWIPYPGGIGDYSVLADKALAPTVQTSAGARIPATWISGSTYKQTAASAWA